MNLSERINMDLNGDMFKLHLNRRIFDTCSKVKTVNNFIQIDKNTNCSKKNYINYLNNSQLISFFYIFKV